LRRKDTTNSTSLSQSSLRLAAATPVKTPDLDQFEFEVSGLLTPTSIVPPASILNDPDLTDEEGSPSVISCVTPSHISKSSKKHKHRRSRGIVKKRPLRMKSWSLKSGETAIFHDGTAKLIINNIGEETGADQENQKANSLHGILPHDPSLPLPEQDPLETVVLPLQSPFRSSFDFDALLPTSDVGLAHSPEPIQTLPQNVLESPIAQTYLYLDD